MLETLAALPEDPILGLSVAFKRDTRDFKIDLGVGVYKDDTGHTPVMTSVAKAAQRCQAEETSKAYIAPAGHAGYLQQLEALLLGADHPALTADRCRSVQTPGGCGALRLAAELIQRARPGAKVWVSNPTWANHIPLLSAAGVQIVEYPYYDHVNKGIDGDAMLAALGNADVGDVVLLHGCCHNPCGADPDPALWQKLATLCAERGLMPLVDVAYLGLGQGLDADAAGLRLLAATVPEMLLANSCSKNFGLYRERTGSLTVIAAQPVQAEIALSQLCAIARASWSMPPSWGPLLVQTVLNDTALRAEWELELNTMRGRINGLRQLLSESLTAAGAAQDFSFIAKENGMFSFLGISPEQVTILREEFGIYMVSSSRINVAGLSETNMPHMTAALTDILSR